MDLEEAMCRAIRIAADSPDTRPNPRVGCVILDPHGEVLGEGCHEAPGGPHAEIAALRVAGDRATRATVVVSLEPCDHQGKTGPCSVALIEAGVARVVFAQADPNPDAAGGASRLRDAGVEVFGGLLADRAAAVNPRWTFAMSARRPFVVWKTAATLDGRIAAADGSSRWITGPEARAEVHRLRAEVDAVLVGTGTALTDDPQLTARHEGSDRKTRQPLRVVMGRRGVPPAARVRRDELGGGFLHLQTRVPHTALRELFARNVHSVLLEGGPTLAAAFVRQNLVDGIVWYCAPALLGSGRGSLGDLGIRTMSQVRRLRLIDVARVGMDVRLEMQVLAPTDGSG